MRCSRSSPELLTKTDPEKSHAEVTRSPRYQADIDRAKRALKELE